MERTENKMARWETNWPVKRAKVREETAKEARDTSASLGLWMLLGAFALGIFAERILQALGFLWDCAHGGCR